MKTFKELTSVMAGAQAVVSSLNQLNILVNIHGELDFDFPDYVREGISRLGIFDQPTLEEKIALCLAVTEEDQNDHIDNSYIDFVNRFFNINVTRTLVSKMHSKFI